jgi:hypothetical protein
VFTAFPLLEIDAVLRRTLRSSVILTAIAASLAIGLGYRLVAPGLVIGLILAIGNHRLFQASALRYTTPEGKVNRKPFAGATLVRLGAATAVALVLLVFVQPMGWGVIGGLAMFQGVLLVNALVVLLAYQRKQGTGVDG